jgi:phosphoenolpyruvate-protein phosphotransferase (PTS system enzyme I)
MVTVYEDIVIVRDLLETQKELFAKKRIKYDPSIQLGALIELPSALMTFEEICEQSDFICLGTNDLIQYTMAADRQLAGVSPYFERGNSVILPQLKPVISKAKKASVPFAVCGELAGNIRFIKNLLDAGLRSFSVAPYLVPAVKNKIYSHISDKKNK